MNKTIKEKPEWELKLRKICYKYNRGEYKCNPALRKGDGILAIENEMVEKLVTQTRKAIEQERKRFLEIIGENEDLERHIKDGTTELGADAFTRNMLRADLRAELRSKVKGDK